MQNVVKTGTFERSLYWDTVKKFGNNLHSPSLSQNSTHTSISAIDKEQQQQHFFNFLNPWGFSGTTKSFFRKPPLSNISKTWGNSENLRFSGVTCNSTTAISGRLLGNMCKVCTAEYRFNFEFYFSIYSSQRSYFSTKTKFDTKLPKKSTNVAPQSNHRVLM